MLSVIIMSFVYMHRDVLEVFSNKEQCQEASQGSVKILNVMSYRTVI